MSSLWRLPGCSGGRGFDGLVSLELAAHGLRIEPGCLPAADGVVRFVKFKLRIAAGVDDRCPASVLTLALKVLAIALVHMPVHHIVGIPRLERRVKAIESSMWQVIQIAHAGGGCMGEQDVAAADHPHFAGQLAHTLGHLALGIHVGTVSVAHGAAKPRNADAAIHVHGVFDTDAAARCMACVAVIVIATYVDERFVDDNTLTVNINRLRRKIEQAGIKGYIETKVGQGYIVP